MNPPSVADPKEGRNHASLFFSSLSPSLEGRAGVGFLCLFLSLFSLPLRGEGLCPIERPVDGHRTFSGGVSFPPLKGSVRWTVIEPFGVGFNSK